MAGIRLTRRAERDLLDIWLSIAVESETSAERMYDRIQARIEILHAFPEAGASREGLAPGARMLVERPYVILYRVVSGGVQIVRVIHGLRDRTAALFDEGLE